MSAAVSEPGPATPAEIGEGLEALCGWAAGLDISDIPDPVRQRAVLILADDIAAIVAARDEPQVRALQARQATRSGPAEATIFAASPLRVDRASAAVANGATADWCELDEGYRRATCHAGLYTIPALIAEAEATGATTLETIRALVIGYEIAARFARTFPQKALVLHPHASLAAVGAAAGVAALRRLDPTTFVAAVSSASTMVAPGPYTHAVEGALVRNVWPGAGAWCGLQAVEWAECGIGGLPTSPYHVFAAAFGSTPVPTELTDGLGREFAVSDGYHKLHACCQYSHSAVEATLALLAERPIAPGTIRAIRVETHRLGMTLDNRAPATTLAAKFSMPHILAATCQLGHAGAEAFAQSTLTDPAIAALRARVELVRFAPDLPWPTDRPARVTLEFDDGTRRTAECLSARGGPDRPFARDEILAKIRGITAPAYPAMPEVLAALVAGEKSGLGKPWAAQVAAMTAGAGR